MRPAKRLLHDQRGSVVVYVAVVMVVLLAFGGGVMDIGMMYENRRQLQNGADGAAMAGAQELLRFELSAADREALAINAALNYAQRNGVPPEQMEDGYPQVACVPLAYNDGCDAASPYYYNAVRVAADRELDLLTTRLLNNGMGDVGALATAVIAPVLPTEGLWPVAVSLCEYPVDWNGDGDTTDCDGPPQGVPVRLKMGAPPEGGSGNFQPLDFPPRGGGGADYEDNFKYGYGNQPGDYIKPSLPWCGFPEAPGCASVDNPAVYTSPGDMAGPTLANPDNVMKYLLSMASGDSNPEDGVDPVPGSQDDPDSAWNASAAGQCTWPNAPLEPRDLPQFGGSASPPDPNWVGNASRCYRVAVVPIIYQTWDELSGASRGVDIVAWGALYLIGVGNLDTGQWSGARGQLRVWGYFMNTAMVAGGRFSSTETGLWAVRLWE